VIAMIIPIRTNTMIAICIQTHVGDISIQRTSPAARAPL
jgi:hypothetical protein